MIRLLILPLALALSGCATVQAGIVRAGTVICDRHEEALAALVLARDNLFLIEGVAHRAAAEIALDSAIAALSACPEEV